MSDTTNVMKGTRSGVQKLIRNQCPHVLDVGCICYLADLAVKSGMRLLPVDVDQLLPARASEQGNVIGSVSVYMLLASERSERDTLRSVQSRILYILGKWLPLESELESFPIFFSSSIALLSSLLSCNFYLLDLKTISSVDILEMT